MKPPAHAIDDAKRRAEGGSASFAGERKSYLEELLMLEYPFAYLEEDQYRVEDTDASHHPLSMEVATLWTVALSAATKGAPLPVPAELVKLALKNPGTLVLLQPERKALFVHGGTCTEAKLEDEEDDETSPSAAEASKRRKLQANFQRLMSTSGGAPANGGRATSVTAEKPSTIGLPTIH